MSSKKLAFFFSVLLMSVLFTACGSDGIDCDNPGNYAVELSNEINAVSAAAIAYSTDPSSANCEAYKDAFRDYIDALQPYGDCLNGSDLSTWQADLDTAEASLDALVC